jgi:hypothetical protein
LPAHALGFPPIPFGHIGIRPEGKRPRRRKVYTVRYPWGISPRSAPGTLDADRVAERTLDALGRGPIVVPGAVNRLAGVLMGWLLPRRAAIRIMAGTTKRLSS